MAFWRFFSRTGSKPLRIFRIEAGSCGGCEAEWDVAQTLSAAAIRELGCRYCSDPAEADILLVTGLITPEGGERLREIQQGPAKVTVALGICPTSGGVFAQQSPLIADVTLLGCPPRPEAMVAALAEAVALCRARP